MVTDVPSTGGIFVVSFLGALFAILASLLIVYTYVTLRLIPKFKQSFRAYVEEIGPKAVFERANLDPTELMDELGIEHPNGAVPDVTGKRADVEGMRIIFTCEDHGRCVGCARVLAQFEAIIEHQGEDSFDEVERKCYAHLKEQIAGDALLDGESEADRQKRIAARVVEALVRDGFKTAQARGVVWAIGKEERATFAGWLSAARSSCEKFKIVDQDDQEVA